MDDSQKKYLKKLVNFLNSELTNGGQEHIEVIVRAIADIVVFKKDVYKVTIPIGLIEKL